MSRQPRADSPAGYSRRLSWAAIPLLAIAAYITVTQLDFLGDDLWLLNEARKSGLVLGVFAPGANWFFYRPLGTLFIWQLGWQLWGFNPLPYHLLGLLAHSLASLALGLWLVELTHKHTVAWVAAAFFAVFPLHMEAVGWVASQWDVWAALLGLLSLWCFTRWWRQHDNNLLYALSLFFFAVGIFTKESLLTFIPVFALTAWTADSQDGNRAAYSQTALNWRRLTVALLPFVAVLALNVGIRLAVLGRLGGYPEARTDYQEFIWDSLIDFARLLVSPVSSLVFGAAVPQVVGLLFTLGLLLGLTIYGRVNARLLLLAFAWILLTLLPVLNFGVDTQSLKSARFLYLPSIAHCIIVATLLYSAFQALMTAAPRFQQVWRIARVSVVGLLLLLGVATTWAQLGPWRAVSIQSRVVDDELLRLIPPPQQPRLGQLWWYIKNQPSFAYGVDVLSLGFSYRRYFNGKGDVPYTQSVQSISDLPLVANPHDAFVVRFYHEKSENLFHVDYVSGITTDSPPPAGEEVGEDLLLWDFTKCAPDTLKEWRAVQAQTECTPGAGLSFKPMGPGGQLSNSGLDYNTKGGTRFLRLRVAVRYGPMEGAGAQTPSETVSKWFWSDRPGGWSEERSRTLRLKRDVQTHVYWSFVPVEDTGGLVQELRFDPSNANLDAQVRWIAADLVR
ncbi:MAG: protein O-mannosyl-transferase [Chloroflexia bacterium]|nr:protein O-mannosyl-transferase [Chloroflexia bacterium]